MGPIKTNLINFKKCSLLFNRILIGIDFGYLVIKVIFLNKNKKNQLEDESCDHITFQEALFKKGDFESAMEWLKANAFVPENKTFAIHGTGVGFLGHKERIESIFGLKVVFVDVDLANGAGHRIAMEQIGEENLRSPIILPDDVYKSEGGMIKMIKDSMENILNKMTEPTDGNPSSTFPCLLFVWDFGSRFYYVDKDGMAVNVGLSRNIGKTFFGMAKCILNTNNYDEIVELAKGGNRLNIDTRIKDILGEFNESEYGKFSPDMPIFPFGIIAEQANQLQEFSRNDMALSLIALNASFIYENCFRICTGRNVTKIYLYGYMFQSDVFQKELENYKTLLPVDLDYIYLDLEYCAALGSIFCSDDKKGIY